MSWRALILMGMMLAAWLGAVKVRDDVTGTKVVGSRLTVDVAGAALADVAAVEVFGPISELVNSLGKIEMELITGEGTVEVSVVALPEPGCPMVYRLLAEGVSDGDQILSIEEAGERLVQMASTARMLDTPMMLVVRADRLMSCAAFADKLTWLCGLGVEHVHIGFTEQATGKGTRSSRKRSTS